MITMNLVFLLKDEQILLAMKKRGFGEGLWNGVGGKVKGSESIEEAARRECEEEINVKPNELAKVAEFKFSGDSQEDMLVEVFFCHSWEGEPSESEEMRPKWFSVSEIPFDKMWADDRHWLPKVLKGETLTGEFYFDSNNQLLDFNLQPANPKS